MQAGDEVMVFFGYHGQDVRKDTVGSVTPAGRLKMASNGELFKANGDEFRRRDSWSVNWSRVEPFNQEKYDGLRRLMLLRNLRAKLARLNWNNVPDEVVVGISAMLKAGDDPASTESR